MKMPSMTSRMFLTEFANREECGCRSSSLNQGRWQRSLATLPWGGERMAGEQGGVGVEVRHQPSVGGSLESEAGREGGAIRM